MRFMFNSRFELQFRFVFDEPLNFSNICGSNCGSNWGPRFELTAHYAEGQQTQQKHTHMYAKHAHACTLYM